MSAGTGQVAMIEVPVAAVRMLRIAWRALARKRAMERELDDELRFHLDMEAARNERAGMSPEGARRAALLAFGGVERHKEAVRDARGVRWLENLGSDVRYALRGIRLRPGLAAAVVLLLALGIGANAAMFGVIDRLLLRAPAGVRDPEGVGRFYFRQTFSWSGLITNPSASYPMYLLLRDRSRALESVGAATWSGARVSLGRGARAQPVRRGEATASYFRVLGVNARLGRLLADAEDRPPVGAPVAVLSDGFWRRHFGGDRGVVGRTIELGGRSYTIVGVLPPGFTGLGMEPVDVWTTFTPDAGGAWYRQWGSLWLTVVGRRRPGVTDAQVEAEATGLFRRGLLEEEAEEGAGAMGPAASLGGMAGSPDGVDPTARAVFGSIVPGRSPGLNGQSSTARVALWLGGVALLVLLIACANVASLLLGRSLARRKEIAVRLALGVGRGRLLRQLLVETLVLASLGAGAALVAAFWGGRLLRDLLVPGMDWQGPPVNGRVLALTGMLVLASTLLAGLAPALQAWRSGTADALKAGLRDGTRRRSRLRTALVVAQGALTVLLLVGAGLFVRSLRHVQAVPRGFDPEHVLLVDPGLTRVAVPPVEAARLTALAAEHLRHLPGVRDVALSTAAPFYTSMSVPLRVPGLDSVPITKDGGPYIVEVSPAYFRTMRTRIVAGRGLTDAGVQRAPRVVVVSATMARVLWPGRNPLGKCLQIGGRDAPCSEVVGVAEDALRQSLEPTPVLQYYVPLAQNPRSAGEAALLVGTTGPAAEAAAAVRRSVLALSPDMPYPDVRPLAALIAPEIKPWRVGATMFTLFGALALLVAALGLYGVLAYEVTQRTPEIAIRLAMGAPTARVLRLVVSEALRVLLIGLALGSLLALLAGPAIEPLLFHQSPRDPAVFATVAGVLLLAAVAAAILPARRASRLDPAEALRAE